jgi:hypothetical protein
MARDSGGEFQGKPLVGPSLDRLGVGEKEVANMSQGREPRAHLLVFTTANLFKQLVAW